MKWEEDGKFLSDNYTGGIAKAAHRERKRDVPQGTNPVIRRFVLVQNVPRFK